MTTRQSKMTTHNERLIVVLNADSSIKSATVFPIEWQSGTEARPLPPIDLTEAELPELAELFGAATIADRDALAAQVAQLQTEKAALSVTVAQLNESVAERDATIVAMAEELDAFRNPPTDPRQVAPYTFLNRFTDQEKVAAFTSTDPIIIVGLAKLQTIITFVDLDLPELVDLVNYMETQGVIGDGRAAEVLADEE